MRRSFYNLKAYPLGHYDALNIEIRATSFVISKKLIKYIHLIYWGAGILLQMKGKYIFVKKTFS